MYPYNTYYYNILDKTNNIVYGQGIGIPKNTWHTILGQTKVNPSINTLSTNLKLVEAKVVRLLFTWCDGSKEIIRSHIDFRLSSFQDDFVRGEVPKDFVRGGISSNSVFIFDEFSILKNL